jgi:uncharacterized protein YjbI with pentapeptide repeats/flagellin-specific chaperone FliS
MNNNKPLIEASTTPRTASFETSLPLEPKDDRAQDESFICDCDEWTRSACQSFPYYSEYEGKRYCVLHYPRKEKVDDFRVAFNKKLLDKDFNFQGVYFPEEVNFNSIEFNDAANFLEAIFNAEANFLETIFNAEANFHEATFNSTVAFIGATFNLRTDFSDATFNGEADFTAVTFKENAITDFSEAKFSKKTNFSFVNFTADSWFWAVVFKESAIADFSQAIFNTKPYFDYTTFSAEVHFNKATFHETVSFQKTTFSADVYFDKAIFKAEIYFDNATFNEVASFRYTQFHHVYFRETIFKDYVWFSEKDSFTEQSYLNLQHARIEKPERLSFHNLTLRPYWFINVDARKFIFTHINWELEENVKRELEQISDEDISYRNELFLIAYRNLALNAEENHRYELASKFRFMAMEAERLNDSGKFIDRAESIFKSFDDFLEEAHADDSPAKLLKLFQLRREKKALFQNNHNDQKWTISKLIRWLYLILSGYGERIPRALFWLVVFLFGFAYLYTLAGFEKPIGNYWDAFSYSLNVVTLQKPEPKALTTGARFLIAAETILVPLQAALLALAIRRKFMR